MPYLQAVVREGMRLHPSTGYILGRQVPAGGVEIASKFIPEGNVIGINPWVAHVNKEVYGDQSWQQAGQAAIKPNVAPAH